MPVHTHINHLAPNYAAVMELFNAATVNRACAMHVKPEVRWTSEGALDRYYDKGDKLDTVPSPFHDNYIEGYLLMEEALLN